MTHATSRNFKQLMNYVENDDLVETLKNALKTKQVDRAKSMVIEVEMSMDIRQNKRDEHGHNTQ